MAVLGVGHIHFHRVAGAYAQERTWHLVIVGPVFVGGAVGQLAQHFGGLEVDGQLLRTACADRLGRQDRILRNVGALGDWRFDRAADDDLADHAGCDVARQGADIGEHALLVGLEHDRGTGALVIDLVRLGGEIGHADVVGGAIAIDQVDLHHGAERHVQGRVGGAFQGPRFAHEDQLAVGDIGAQREGEVWPVLDGRALGRFGVCAMLGHGGRHHGSTEGNGDQGLRNCSPFHFLLTLVNVGCESASLDDEQIIHLHGILKN